MHILIHEIQVTTEYDPQYDLVLSQNLITSFFGQILPTSKIPKELFIFFLVIANTDKQTDRNKNRSTKNITPMVLVQMIICVTVVAIYNVDQILTLWLG